MAAASRASAGEAAANAFAMVVVGCYASGGDVTGLVAQGAIVAKAHLNTRRPNLERAGWFGSTLYVIVKNWDSTNFRSALRLPREAFDMVVNKLQISGAVTDNECHNQRYRVPAWFKVATAVYHMAYGGGSLFQTACAAGVAMYTVHCYLHDVCRGIFIELRPIFMHPLTPVEAEQSQLRFAMRGGVENVGLAVDGTHVPWKPDNADWAE
eukprot:jgi/Tetstr1/438617/TSEL_027168.t1